MRRQQVITRSLVLMTVFLITPGLTACQLKQVSLSG